MVRRFQRQLDYSRALLPRCVARLRLDRSAAARVTPLRRHRQPSGSSLAGQPAPQPRRSIPVARPDRRVRQSFQGRPARARARARRRGARLEFDQAVDVLLESPYGGRTEPRIREHFDRLVDRISAYEVKALAEGDGFTEKKYEPASIDELLALSATFSPPPATPELKDAVRADLRAGRARHSDSAQPAGAVLHRAVPGPAARLPRRKGMNRGSKYLPMIQNVLPRRRPAARPRLRAARRERVQAERAVARQGQGRLAVHARHRARERPASGLVHRRAVGSREGHGRRGQVPRHAREMFDGDWHLALASYNGGPGPRAARHRRAASSTTSGSWRPKAAAPAARDARLRPDDSRGDRHREEPGAVRLRVRDRAAARVRDGDAAGPVDLRRIAEWADTTIDEIQALNPELRRWTTPVRDDAATR